MFTANDSQKYSIDIYIYIYIYIYVCVYVLYVCIPYVEP